MANETNYDSLFAKVVLDQDMATAEELRDSQKELKMRSQTSPITLKDLLVEKNYITRSQADRILRRLTESKAAPHQIPGYRILDKLGSGAMAVVYKAEQLSLNRTVAIKVLPKKLSENPEYVQRFYKEGQAAAKLNHNNIVQAFDVGEAGGYHYFVMEYVQGKTIYDDLAQGKPFPEKQAIEIITQVAKALEHAHARGLIHRDVKPKNIMINTAGDVKLADMGLARGTQDIEAAKTEAGKAYGTPYYIAPEQIKGEMNIDGRADIYSLGATFYHMVTGRVPFGADDPADVMRKHLKEKLIPPDHINTQLSGGTSEVIEVMMAKDKNDRYENAEVLLQDLDAITNNQPPVRARTKFDISEFKELENGETLEPAHEELPYIDELIARYRAAVIALAVTSVVLLLIVIVFLVKLTT